MGPSSSALGWTRIRSGPHRGRSLSSKLLAGFMPIYPVSARMTSRAPEPVRPPRYGDVMTAHEVFTSLFWVVLLGYVVYLGWSIRGWVIDARASRKRR